MNAIDTRRFDVVDSYPLSSLQQGILFHCLDAAEQGVYVDQIFCTLDEAIDTPALARAWRRVFERHPILRTSFRWEGMQEPIQEIHRRVEVPFELLDWRNFTQSEQQVQSDALLARERRQGFDLSNAPITRLTLIQCADRQYKLLWTYHHILVDGRSTFLIMDEVFQYYQAFRDRRDLEIAPPRPYGDYIDWLQGQEFVRYEDYWRTALKGFLTPAQLRLPPVEKKHHEAEQIFAAQELAVPADTTARVDAFAKAHGLTLNTMIQGAWALLLHHYSGENDIVFGATRACRYSSVKGAETMVGLFLNTLPMRVALHPEARMMDALRDLRRQQVELRDYEQTPLHQVQLWSEIERGKQLFESIVVFESTPADGPLRAKGGEWSNRRFQHKGQSHYPLTFDVCVDSQLFLRIQYDRRCFDDGSIERMLRHLQNLLVGMIADPERSIGQISPLSESEKHQLLRQWNDTVESFSTHSTVHQLFEAQAERTPDAIAVEFNGRRLSYRDLNARANQVARYLKRRGVGPEKLVGVCFERSVEMIEALLGVLKAGGGYVPMDPTYPPERLAYMLDDAKIAVLLTEDRWRRKLALSLSASQSRSAPFETVCVDRVSGQIDQESTQNLACDSAPEDLAYVIYTSGSTGSPKGVGIAHRSLVNCLNSMRDQLAFTERDTLLAVTTISFDIAGIEIYLPLITGAKILLAGREDVADGSRLVKLLMQHAATAMQATPSTWRLLLEAGWQGADRFKILCGGESLAADLVAPLLARGVVWNLYGPTETTIWSTAHRLTPGDASIPIGRPIANTEIYVLDGCLHPAPIGIPGELHIGGAGLARGYLNRPELTAKKFIANPFSTNPTARLYKTGDLVRYLPDGNLEFVGRIDNQVKVRGFRIELGEIENILARHPGIRQAAVLAREDNPQDKRLVAYIVPRPELDLTTDRLRSYLKDQLPEYMIPSAFVLLDDLPLTPNGKIDRKALPSPDQNRLGIGGRYQSPRTTMEQALAGIWAEVLGVDKVGIHDNFFDLGGHSLVAVRLVNLIKRKIGLTLRIAHIYQAPTVKQMAGILDNREAATLFSSLVPLQTKGAKPAFYWVHGDSSNAYLTRYLDAEQCLYGLQHQSTDGQPARYRSVEDIAAHYLKEICAVQPYGPYRLGGNCFGGLVAFEIANQLQSKGEKIDLLVLLNPATPVTAGPLQVSRPIRTKVNDLRHLLQLFSSLRSSGRWNEGLNRVTGGIIGQMRNLLESAKRANQKAVCKIYDRLGASIPASLRSRYILEIYFRALRYYVGRPFQGDMVLLLGQDYSRQHRAHWSKQCTGRVTIHDVRGDHNGVLEERNVKVWAKHLAAYLRALAIERPAVKSVKKSARALAFQ